MLVAGCASAPQPLATTTPVASEGPGSRLYDQVLDYFALYEATNLDSTEHHFAYADLNNDETLDVVVLLTDQYWCIGDSCTVMIFVSENNAIRLISKLTLVNGPVAVGEIVTAGWRDLYVRLPGRSSLAMARVSFDGIEYPNSPSKWEITLVSGSGPGRLLLSGGTETPSFYARTVIEVPALEQGATPRELTQEQLDELLAGTDTLLEQGQQELIDEAVDRASPAPAGPVLTQLFSGRYSWGPGEAFFRPCGGSSLYWVETEDGVDRDLDKAYRQIASLQYDDVFAVVKARRLPPAAEGAGRYYDGVLMVSELELMQRLDSESCSRL